MPYGDYKVQVKYYADHDEDYESTQAVPYSVNVRWVKTTFPDGTALWESVDRSGVLTSVGQIDTVYTVDYEEPDLSDFELVPNAYDLF